MGWGGVGWVPKSGECFVYTAAVDAGDPKPTPRASDPRVLPLRRHGHMRARTKFMLPKRRFSKDEQSVACAFLKYCQRA